MSLSHDIRKHNLNNTLKSFIAQASPSGDTFLSIDCTNAQQYFITN